MCLEKFFLICNLTALYAEFFFDRNFWSGVTNVTTWSAITVGVQRSTAKVVTIVLTLIALKEMRPPSRTSDDATCKQLKQTAVLKVNVEPFEPETILNTCMSPMILLATQHFRMKNIQTQEQNTAMTL